LNFLMRMPDLAEKTTAATLIYNQIKRDLLRGVFPAGQKLHIGDLSDRYDSSINPVREALSRLAAEMIIEQRDQRGFSVPSLTRSALEELVKTRCWLEETAVRESIRNANEDYELGIVTTYHRLARVEYLSADGAPNPDWEERHRAFHGSLIANCGSSWLLSFCDQLSFQATRARYLAVTTRHDPGRLRNDEHKDLMEAAVALDADRTVELLVAHYRKTLDLVQPHIGF
jgi:GntR family transcriptional regulator, carbon starvation induced regulator